MSWNLSYSSYSLFKSSPLQFYYAYLKKEIYSDKILVDYGKAGNVVHKAMEDYINGKGDTFNHYWDKYDGDNFVGFRNIKLSKKEYKAMFQYGISVYNSEIKDKKVIAQTELFMFKKIHGIMFKSYIDLYIQNSDNNVTIMDWKTNSTHNYEMHKDQRLFYSWAIWNINGTIPVCKWVYFKHKKIYEDKFSEQEMIIFDDKIQRFLKNVREWGMDISKYDGGDWKNPFNQYYALCKEEMEKRQSEEYIEIHMSIKGNYIFFDGDVNSKLEEGIDYKTKFDLPDKFWMQQQVKKKAKGKINLAEIGTVHLYNKKFKCFPIGLLDPITKICYEFATYYNKQLKIFLNDNRDEKYLNQTLNIMPDKLHTDKIFRDYQVTAITRFLEKYSGIINIATGGGKTLVAAEIIRQCDAKTLWIIDRKELLNQTKKVLEELLGIKIGTITNGEINIKDVTIATVQSLNSKLYELRDYLYTVNFVCIDEFHKSAAESYQKIFAKLPNTKYRLGLTATPTRDDGKEPILFSILSDIIYKIDTNDLIKMGYLVKPTIEFYALSEVDMFTKTYAEDYNINIVKNDERNNKIKEIVANNPDKKILILTKIVSHGKHLNKIIPESIHLHGKSANRNTAMYEFRYGDPNIMIMTLSIGAEGLDIPDLDIIINAGANKGDQKSIQILGRVLRLFKNKNSALYIDFIDNGKYVRKHSIARMNAFKNQRHDIVIKQEPL